MRPADLAASSFSSYPAGGRAFAMENLAVLRETPLAFAIILLREIIGYDWRFPAEIKALDAQLAWLRSISSDKRQQVTSGFAGLTLTPQIVDQPWVEHPQQASEDLTAYLWSTHQMDAFHAAAAAYADALHTAVPEKAPEKARLCVVVLGEGLQFADYPLFRKLRPHGVFFPTVDGAQSMQAVTDAVSIRIAADPQPYQHWFIDGATGDVPDSRLVRVSWSETAALRAAILARMQQVIQIRGSGPEQLRTELGTITPADLGLVSGKDDVLSRFKVSLLTEGSGTQIFSTTFAQWAARETLRRAQPSTLIVRFGPRQRQLPMDELIAGATSAVADPAGSLVDADMGAFYTWINQQRLSGAENAKFIAWSQAHRQAIVIGTGLPRGTTAPGVMNLKQLLAL